MSLKEILSEHIPGDLCKIVLDYAYYFDISDTADGTGMYRHGIKHGVWSEYDHVLGLNYLSEYSIGVLHGTRYVSNTSATKRLSLNYNGVLNPKLLSFYTCVNIHDSIDLIDIGQAGLTYSNENHPRFTWKNADLYSKFGKSDVIVKYLMSLILST
jgi:hypothetical protein